jgi:hypothetical protein
MRSSLGKFSELVIPALAGMTLNEMAERKTLKWKKRPR